MTTNAMVLAGTTPRFRRPTLAALPAPVLFLLAGGVGGAWGWLMQASGATATPPVAFLAVGLAAAIASIGGFAFAAVCGAMLMPLLNDPVRAVQVMLICSIANQAMGLWSIRRDIAWRALLPYLAGGVLGVPLGLAALLGAEAGLYTRTLGGLLVAYAAWMAFGRRLVLPPMGRLAEGVVGLLGGVMGGLAAFPSGPMTVWCSLQGWDKARQRGVYQPFILPMQVLAVALLALAAPGRGGAPAFDAAALLFVPASLLGTACGIALFRRMSDRQFGQVVAAMLLLSGLAMVVR